MSFEFLKDLTEAQRRELHARLALDLRSGDGTFERHERGLWDLVGELMPAYEKAPLGAFAEKFGRQRYRDASARLEALLDRALPPASRKPARDALRRIVLRALHDYLNECQVPLSAKSLLGAFDNLEYAVDRQFPGYIAARLLHRVVLALA